MISQRAIDLSLSAEGVDQPGKWPGASSGITLGFGYDLGYVSQAEFARDWRVYLTAGQVTRLGRAIGVTGSRAKALAPEFRDMKVTRSVALAVFMAASLPKFERLTKEAFPGCDRVLPADAFGALVSLVFNRGTDMGSKAKGTWDRRREMRSIRDRIAEYGSHADKSPRSLHNLLAAIGGEIRSMKRLWVGQGVDGLLTRRDAEAAMVEGAA